MKHRATGRPRGRPPSLPYDLAEQILRDLESRMDHSTMLIRPEIASMARKLNVSRSSIKREIVSIRNNGFATSIKAQLTRSVPSCTESFAPHYQAPTLIVAHNSRRRGSKIPLPWLKNPPVVAQKSPSSTYALRPAYPDHKPLLTAEKGKRGTRSEEGLAASHVRRSHRRRRADDAVCHALLNGMPGNGHETQRRPRRVASLVIPFGGILCYKHWKMAFFSYGTMPLHASTDAEHEFMNCLCSS